MSPSKLARFTRRDKVLVVSAFIALISLFVPWYQASVSGYTIQSVSGWGSGYGWLGAVCLVFAGIYVVLQRLEVDLPKAPFRASVTLLALTGLGTVIVLLRMSTLPSGHVGGALISYRYGPAVGIVLALLAGLVETACAFLLFKQPAKLGVVAAGTQVPDHADESA
jgi:hypothetical protein